MNVKKQETTSRQNIHVCINCKHFLRNTERCIGCDREKPYPKGRQNWEDAREGKCIYYKENGGCSCNNDPDDLGECVYDNGYKTPKAQIECRYFTTKQGMGE